MGRRIDVEVKAGLFILIAIVLIFGAVFTMGGTDFILNEYRNVYVVFNDVKGLTIGGKIRASGIKIGRVKNITFNEKYDSVTIHMLIDEKYIRSVREDSIVKIQTQGVLGDKYLEVLGGDYKSQIVKDNGFLQPDESEGILEKGDDIATHLKESLINIRKLTHDLVADGTSKKLMKNLLEVSENLKVVTKEVKVNDLNNTLANLKRITDGIQNGEGTVGALLKDPSLYDDIKNLVDGANRSSVLKYVVRTAVKNNDDAKKSKNEEVKAN